MKRYVLSIAIVLGLIAMPICVAQTSTTSAFFGMSETNPARNGWPSVGFKTLRSWNAYPPVSWKDINSSKGVYKWQNLDNLVSLSQSRGVDILYTFGRTPVWASSNPTGVCKNTTSGTCYPPSNQQDWKDFVSAITARYAGKIKYWEIWNESNALNSWSGTLPQLLTMAQNAYPIIKASSSGAVAVSPGPQGPSGYRWLDLYLAAGGGAYADAFAFHGYVGSSNGVANPPEQIVPLVANLKLVTSRYGQGSKPLWDTEHGWGANTSLPNQDQQAAWLARHTILSWSKGVSHSLWYLWDSDDQGTLWDSTYKTRQPGIAYGEVYKWLVGATLTDPCSMASDSIWTCTFTRANGQQGQITWKSSGSASAETVPGQYSQYSDLTGNTFAIPLSQSVTIGSKPVLLLTDGSSSNAAPTAALAVTPLAGTAALTVTADSSGSADRDGSIVSRTINFGDGTMISTMAGSHTYQSVGSFQVNLSVKDNSGMVATASQTVVVSNVAITVAVSPSTVTLQSGSTQQFSAAVQNSSNHAVVWSASLGSISSSGLYTAPAVSANTSVTVTAKSSADTSKSAVAHVTVTPPSAATASVTNPGFELGAAGWFADTINGGTVSVVTNSTAAHGGTKYAEAKSAAGNFVAYFAAGSDGRPQYFPVKPGQVITFGGWVNRVSGNGFARWKIQVSDAAKSNITHVSPGSGNVETSGWTWMQGSYTVPTGKAYVRFELQIYQSTVPSVVRFDDGMLQVK